MQETSCGNHEYVEVSTCIGIIYQCRKCPNWTRKTPAKTWVDVEFKAGRKLTRTGKIPRKKSK